jgi:SsrA-binding protein
MSRDKKKGNGDGVVAQNRRAKFDFEIEDSLEAGLVLAGTEVKSLRAGGGVLSDAWAQVDRGEAWLHAMKIAAYSHGNITNHAVERTRKLLLNKSEIERLFDEMKRGMQLIPTRVYFKNGRAKVEIAIGRPRKAHDKRHAIKDREQQEEMRKATGRLSRGRGGDDD